MAYKRELLSTNQPIQLLDKSTFFTISRRGTTATYNNDGTFTVSGTATADDWKNFPVFQLLSGGGEHVYLFDVGEISEDANCCCNIYFYDEKTDRAVTLMKIGVDSSGFIRKLSSPTVYQARFNITTLTGATPNNIVYKPQLFDLTAIFGVGNEPKTVAEFKAKYPNELYDYRTSNSLTSYKKILKVSDVCQLLDKSKYPATGTYDGVIYTNNGDGTITLNGTATANTNYNLQWNISVIEGHKYLPFFYNTNIGQPYLLLYSDDTEVFDKRFPGASGSVVTCLKTYNAVYYQIKVSTGTSVSNLITKPQLFDLTEMYGAGNEPATVAEFKAKFPNELYDYSPRCWVKSYKTGLIAKTKNLFNINALTPYTPETLPYQTAGRYNGHIITKCDDGTSVSKSNKLLKELCPDLVAGERYILHFDTNGTGSQANTIYLYATESVWLNGYTHIVTEAELNGTVYFYGNYPSLDVATISNFQIEKGTTATDYVPYGYL